MGDKRPIEMATVSFAFMTFAVVVGGGLYARRFFPIGQLGLIGMHDTMRSDAQQNAMPWSLTLCGATLGHNHFVHHLVSINVSSHCNLASLVELGTGFGGLTYICGLLGVRHSLDVHSFDSTRHFDDAATKVFDALRIRFTQVDIFSPMGQEAVRQAIGNLPVYLICDNGNKPAEFRIFVPLLAPGSLVSVHDYGYEFHDEDAAAFPGLEPVDREEWTRYDCRFATWRVIGPNRPDQLPRRH